MRLVIIPAGILVITSDDTYVTLEILLFLSFIVEKSQSLAPFPHTKLFCKITCQLCYTFRMLLICLHGTICLAYMRDYIFHFIWVF